MRKNKPNEHMTHKPHHIHPTPHQAEINAKVNIMWWFHHVLPALAMYWHIGLDHISHYITKTCAKLRACGKNWPPYLIFCMEYHCNDVTINITVQRMSKEGYLATSHLSQCPHIVPFINIFEGGLYRWCIFFCKWQSVRQLIFCLIKSIRDVGPPASTIPPSTP